MRTILSLLLFVSATYVQAQETVEHYAFKALLNGKIPVEVAFEGRQNDTDWMTAGYIYYPKAKNPAPIPEFENMQEVDIDSKTKTISSRIRTTTGMCIDTYKWKNGKLNKISTKNI